MITVTFAQNTPKFGFTDFERLIIQSIDSNLEKLQEQFKPTYADISYCSSIKIYQHEGNKLTNKAKLIVEYPCSLQLEFKILETLLTS